jgi:hypothetical protein
VLSGNAETIKMMFNTSFYEERKRGSEGAFFLLIIPNFRRFNQNVEKGEGGEAKNDVDICPRKKHHFEAFD